jgi:uncharacterized protein
MKLLVKDISEAPQHLAYEENVDELDARLTHGSHEFQSRDPLSIELTHYRAGGDLIFTGSLKGHLVGNCGRCLEPFDHPLELPFTLVLTPRRTQPGGDAGLTADDVAFTFYEGPEIDLTPLLHEQVILALPTRALCRDDCRGLCSVCGANLNTKPCGCAAAEQQSPFAVLKSMTRGR